MKYRVGYIQYSDKHKTFPSKRITGDVFETYEEAWKHLKDNNLENCDFFIEKVEIDSLNNVQVLNLNFEKTLLRIGLDKDVIPTLLTAMYYYTEDFENYIENLNLLKNNYEIQ